jgi:hypothetical protein
MSTNLVYSLLTQTLTSTISQHRSKIAVTPEIKTVLTKLVADDNQAIICLQALFYSRFYSQVDDSVKSYEERNLSSSGALAYIRKVLSSDVTGDIQRLMSVEELSEFSGLKCYLDKFAYLVKTVVVHNV